MVYLRPILVSLLSLSHAAVSLAQKWHFKDGSVAVQAKGSPESSFKDKLAEYKALKSPVDLGTSDSLKCLLTIHDGKAAKKPHQAFLHLTETESGLDISYPFSVKESGKAKVDLTQKDIPSQFFRASKPIEVSLVIGSFGTSTGYNERLFSLQIGKDPNKPAPVSTKPLRYGKLPEIHHVFKSDPTSPNILFSFIFTIAALVTLPALAGAWLYLGGNLNHFSKAIQAAPVSHALFYGSVIGMEGIFVLYYTSWNLFQTLPVILAVAVVAFLSGSRALSEVQGRRLARQR